MLNSAFRAATVAAVLLGLPFAMPSAFAAEYEPTWDSLSKHPMPEWLVDAKFGIYAHWGVYSVPAYQTEWYPKWMYQEGHPIYKHHKQKYGDPAEFGYRKFVPMFKAENFDPDDWAKFVEASGAKYAGLAVVHHDGFLLWDSKINRWNAKQMGPKRDIYGEYCQALRKRGLRTIATEHHIRTFNWYLPGTDGFGKIQKPELVERVKDAGYDLIDPAYADLYWNEMAGCKLEDFLAEWQAKVREVIDNYQPDVLWFDGGDFRGTKSEKVVLNLLAHYHNRAAAWGKPVEVLNKLPATMVFNFPEDYGMLTFEEGRDRPARVERAWIDDMKISDKGWCYVAGQQYKTADEILDGLIDRTARGGGLLLNLSPMADGTIPAAQKEALLGIGRWLKLNGEAIYGTRPWKVYAEGDERKLRTGVATGDEAVKRHPQWKFANCDASDVRFTTRGDALYAIVLGWPTEPVVIRSLAQGSEAYPGEIGSITLLGSSATLEYERSADGLRVTFPAENPCDYAYVLKIMGK
ncbi:MAG: alpha-L-fucosidase [Planctomycetota bacterium]